MTYKASFDNIVWIATFFVFGLFIGIGQESVRELSNAHGDQTTIILHTCLLVFFSLIVFLSWYFAPKSYTLENGLLYINRPAGKIKISVADATLIRTLTKEELGGGIRIFGVGGLFGYYGRFQYPKIGNVRLYATQRKNYILIITTDNKKIIITPDDMGMAEAMKSSSLKNNLG